MHDDDETFAWTSHGRTRATIAIVKERLESLKSAIVAMAARGTIEEIRNMAGRVAEIEWVLKTLTEKE